MTESDENQVRRKHSLKHRVKKTTDAEIRSAKKASLRRKLIFLGILAAVALMIFLLILLIRKLEHKKQYSAMETVQELELPGEGNQYELFADGILRYSSNCMPYMTMEGKAIWDQSLSMQDPEPELRGDYGLIWDRNGRSALLFDSTSGCVASIRAENDLVDAGLSAYGVSALMMRDNSNNYIRFYDRFGSPLEIEIKNVLTETSGYPLTMSLSSDGTGLVLSLVFMDPGSFRTRISFLNFDTGKDYADRVVGLFTYEETLFPQVDYLSASSVVAFGTDRLAFFSLDSGGVPTQTKLVEYTSEIRGTFTGGGRAAVICAGEKTGEELLQVYNGSGERIFEKTLTERYDSACFSGGYLILYNSGSCMILDADGNVKFSGGSFSSIGRIASSGKNRFLLFDGSGIREVKLK